MINLNFKVVPKQFHSNSFNERLSDCTWKLGKNNPELIRLHPQWSKEPLVFVYNRNYRDIPEYSTNVIFSVGFLGEVYIERLEIDPLKHPYWCGTVVFDRNIGQLDIYNIHEWIYNPNVERSKKEGWLCATNLKDIFEVHVEL